MKCKFCRRDMTVGTPAVPGTALARPDGQSADAGSSVARIAHLHVMFSSEILPEKGSEVGNLTADSTGYVPFGTFDARGIELLEFLPRVTRYASTHGRMAPYPAPNP